MRAAPSSPVSAWSIGRDELPEYQSDRIGFQESERPGVRTRRLGQQGKDGIAAARAPA
jgi:hypothetical protein